MEEQENYGGGTHLRSVKRLVVRVLGVYDFGPVAKCVIRDNVK